MKRKYEIHCVKIESISSNASVKGKVSGGGFTIGGTGGSTVSGKTETVHTSYVNANGRLYEFSQKNDRYPFREGDDMVFLCRKDNGSGKYMITSLINNTNGTRDIKPPLLGAIFAFGVCFLTAAILALFIYIFSAPIALYGVYYVLVEYPNFQKATNALLALEGKRDKQAMESVLKNYSFEYVISGY